MDNARWLQAIKDRTMMYWQHQRHIDERRGNITLMEEEIRELRAQMEIEALQLAGLGMGYVPTNADAEAGDLSKYVGIAAQRINPKHGEK